MSLKRFDQLVGELRRTLAGLPDKRTGTNTQYTMETIGLSAFSVFFTQCPSFLAHQKAMQQNKGQNNAQTLFQIIPAGRQHKAGLRDQRRQALAGQERGVLPHRQ